MNQSEMLHQMCREVLTEADIRAICKNRGLPNQAASSRAILESLFLSDTGVAVAMKSLDPTEIALLHLLRSQERPVGITFFRRFQNPPEDKVRSYGTFSQRFQGVFSAVKDRLVRRGILLLVLGPDSSLTKAKMERWQFVLPVQFARHLPPLVESSPLSGEGNWRGDAARDKLKTALGQGAESKTQSDRVEIVDHELCWGGELFQYARLVQWLKHQWQGDTTPTNYKEQTGSYTLPPAEAVLRILTGLEAGHWSEPAALAVPLEVFCGFQVDAARVCESGWRWGFLAQQEAENRMWYRLAPLAATNIMPERYLLVRGGEVSVNLDTVPLEVLETLVRMSKQQHLPGKRPLLLLKPNLVKLGRMEAPVAATLLIDWLQKNVPAFQQAFEIVRQRRGKTILHENLSVARVSDLSLKVALEKSLGSRIVALSEEFIAFPKGALAEVRRLVAQMGHVVKEITSHET